MPFSEQVEHIIQKVTELPLGVGLSLAMLIAFVGLFAFRWVLIFILSRLLPAPEGRRRNLILTAIKGPLTIALFALLVVLLGALLSEYEVGSDRIHGLTSVVANVFLILAVILFADKISQTTIERYSKSSSLLNNSRDLVKGVSRIFVLVIGVLIGLSTLGISITPIVASMGIGSLAIALALQPTLESFFSGFQLVADKIVRVGDYIELETGEQGFVEKVGWRSTWIKMLPNNFIIIPNSKLSNSKLINYYYPSPELSVPVEVGVHYDSDLDHVERVTLEVARHVLKTHKWGVSDYETFVVFHTFDSSSINFTVMLRAKEYFNRFFVKSEFIKLLHKRYAKEGITIPYPIRAINTMQEHPSERQD
ncbi:mechanosensitive ion channel family protein [Hirschia baltica]|uniref:Small-conductance mechanosensitive channel n=1 Tax=Hirschia baltica (strain ATCC 49814 / DSM 5838 / IFAM 1418) TaxID=582402 RepID=C6XRK8_HIRBI|nr:mechanosensitive ion channel family protein [Hirschia baltica]ACT60618.1 MscS Mechanosensitive ion channel [Hirschia baltica ATCC 49814]